MSLGQAVEQLPVLNTGIWMANLPAKEMTSIAISDMANLILLKCTLGYRKNIEKQ